MKKLSKILLGAGIVASLAACDRKAEFTTSSFVAFNASSAEVAEDAGSLQIPVYAYAKNGDYAFPRSESASTSVTFEVVDGTAVNGTDFTVEPANGVLTFNGSSEGSITVTPVNHAGVRTGDLSFTIRLTGASDGYTLGGSRETTVTIRDLDHPLASILGSYTATGTDQMLGQGSWTVTLSADESDESIVWVTGVNPLAASNNVSVPGTVTTADDGSFTITMPYGYDTGVQANAGTLVFCSCDYSGGYFVDEEGQAVLTQTSTSPVTFYTEDSFGLYDRTYVYNGGFVLPGGVTWVKN